jgi:hypothetical protein
MRIVVLALVVLVASCSAAFSYCPQVPDDASTNYVQNQTQLTLCRQNEAALTSERQVRDLQLQQTINQQTQLLLAQQQQLQQLQSFTPLPYFPR